MGTRIRRLGADGLRRSGLGLAANGGLLARRLRRTSARTSLGGTVQLESAANTRGAVQDERTRVARELHDILSHSLGAVVLQTSAADHAWEADPQRAHEAVVAAHDTALEAVGQLRTLLMIVREDPSEDRSAVPTIDDLEGLASRTSAGGFKVGFQVEGVPVPVPAVVQACVYRVAQEGITNAYALGNLRVHVVRPLPPRIHRSARRRPGAKCPRPVARRWVWPESRDRAALFGGRMRAGPRSTGGWALSVEFPR